MSSGGEGSRQLGTVVSKVLSGKHDEAKGEIAKMGFQGVKFNLKISIKNPQDTTITILGGTYSIKGKCSVVATGTIPGPQSQPGGGTKKPEFQVQVDASTLAELVKNATASDHSDNWDVDFDLNISIMIEVPIFGTVAIEVLRHKEIMKFSGFQALLFNDVVKKVPKALTNQTNNN